MKKNVLFICCDMRSGGVQKSLATLLNCLNYDTQRSKFTFGK